MNVKSASAPTTDLHFRTASPDDLDGIMSIEEACFLTPWPREAIVNELVHNSFSTTVVAVEDDEVVGFMIFWSVADERHLQNIATAHPHRKRGIARSLTDILIADARNCSAVITLEVRETNREARGLYDKLGFVTVGKRPGYYADTREDALVMLLDLRSEQEPLDE